MPNTHNRFAGRIGPYEVIKERRHGEGPVHEMKKLGDEAAWLIEDAASEPSKPLYWNATEEWTYDHLRAVRFCREVDAQTVGLTVGRAVRIAEHAWMQDRG